MIRSFYKDYKRRIIPAGIILIAVLLAVLLVRFAPVNKPDASVKRSTLIRTLSLIPGDYSPNMILYGRVYSARRVTIAAKVSDTIRAVNAMEGQVVNANTPLVIMDDDDSTLDVQKAQHQLKEMELLLNQANINMENDKTVLVKQKRLLQIEEKNLEKQKQLFKRNIISQKEFDNAENSYTQQLIVVQTKTSLLESSKQQVSVAVSRLQQAKVAFLKLQQRKGDHLISAPFKALVVAVDVAPHQQVAVGQGLVQLLPVDEIPVRALIPTTQLSAVQSALDAGDSLTASTMINGDFIRLPLINIAAKVNAGQLGREAIFKAKVGGEKIVDGQYLNLNLSLPKQKQVFKAPLSALYGKDSVYRVLKGHLEKVKVNIIGRVYQYDKPTWFVFKSTLLHPCDKILVSPIANAIDGLSVTLDSDNKSTICHKPALSQNH
jgi:multidrug efflux pump subunit AcrA (membrane-fusion protein)